MSSTQIFRSLLWLSGYLCAFGLVIKGAPVPAREEKSLVLMPVLVPATGYNGIPPPPVHSADLYYQQYLAAQGHPNPQTRGPFDFVGQFFQQVPWLPIQINVPDMFQNIGNGISQATSNVQQWSQNLGHGVSQLTENVGSGLNQLTQNVGSGFNQWMQQVGQRVPFLGNIVNTKKPLGGTNHGQQQIIMMVPVEYPGGQQLVMEDAIDAFP
ncbi:uncharacterized protein [Euwallacea similis]|uniref:uncharacterized protein n=1 Tax=Euwallacea similis TaxID=1736056 RepID=UPI00344E47E9